VVGVFRGQPVPGSRLKAVRKSPDVVSYRGKGPEEMQISDHLSGPRVWTLLQLNY